MKASLFLCLICVLVFIYTLSLPSDAQDSLVERYGFSGENLFSHPDVLLTSTFLHGSWEHLLSNILILFFFGSAVEGELGKRKMLLIFFLGAIAGDLFSLIFYFTGIYGWSLPSIGASAGVFALIGTGMLVRPFDLSYYPYLIPIPLAFLGLIYAVYNAIGFVAGPSNISYIAHFGGLFLGLYFGFKHEGWREGLRIILVMIMIMILTPYIWTTLMNII